MIHKNDFIQWFENEVKVRWPKHNFSLTELGDWHWRLRDFEVDTLTEAVRRHKAVDDWRVPSLKKVYDCAAKIHLTKHPKQHRKQTTGVPEAHTYIMCTAKDERGRGIVGWFVPILIWPFHKAYTAETYRRCAEQQLAMHARRGDVWEVFTQTDHGEMLQRRCALLGIQPLDLTGRRSGQSRSEP